MRYSVVICTKNRARSLEMALESIKKIRFAGDWEIIVVDNGSTDETREIAHEVLRSSNVPSRVMVENRPGNSWGRNTAIEVAKGEFGFFTDDDCLAEPDILDALEHPFADKRVGFVSGRILLANPTDYLCCYFDRVDPLTFRAPRLIRPGFVQGSNMAFRLQPVRDVGSFDVRFGAGARFAGEDLELAMRLMIHGWEGRYEPRSLVYHNHGRSKQAYERLEPFYDEGVGAYIEKILSHRSCTWMTKLSVSAFLLRTRLASSTQFNRFMGGRLAFRAVDQS